jgi:hypothetical protein
VQAAARDAVGLRAHHASPLWTLQRLCFGLDVAAAQPTAERTVTPGQHRNRKRSLTTEARLENGSPLARGFMEVVRGLVGAVMCSACWCGTYEPLAIMPSAKLGPDQTDAL